MTKHMLPLLACAALAAALAWSGVPTIGAEEAAGPGLKPLLRRPVALALADDGKWLFTANQRGGSVSVIDTAAGRTVNEVAVGGQLADLVATPDGNRLLAVDEAG